MHYFYKSEKIPKKSKSIEKFMKKGQNFAYSEIFFYISVNFLTLSFSVVLSDSSLYGIIMHAYAILIN